METPICIYQSPKRQDIGFLIFIGLYSDRWVHLASRKVEYVGELLAPALDFRPMAHIHIISMDFNGQFTNCLV